MYNSDLFINQIEERHSTIEKLKLFISIINKAKITPRLDTESDSYDLNNEFPDVNPLNRFNRVKVALENEIQDPPLDQVSLFEEEYRVKVPVLIYILNINMIRKKI